MLQEPAALRLRIGDQVASELRAVTLADIQDNMRTLGVAAFKIPDRLITVDELPMTKVGKIDKKTLRADIAARLQQASTGP